MAWCCASGGRASATRPPRAGATPSAPTSDCQTPLRRVAARAATPRTAPRPPPGDGPLTSMVRGALLFVIAGLLAIFAVALWIQPYHEEGHAVLLATHRQLGLPECAFKVMTGKPCPSCGMTTSFALLVRA